MELEMIQLIPAAVGCSNWLLLLHNTLVLCLLGFVWGFVSYFYWGPFVFDSSFSSSQFISPAPPTPTRGGVRFSGCPAPSVWGWAIGGDGICMRRCIALLHMDIILCIQTHLGIWMRMRRSKHTSSYKLWTCIHMHEHAYLWMHAHKYAAACMSMHMQTYLNIRIYVHTYELICIPMQVHVSYAHACLPCAKNGPSPLRHLGYPTPLGGAALPRPWCI